jgi:hypothetical protein
VQFNNAGSFSGSPYFRYLSESKSLNVGSINISGATSAGFNLENLNGSIKIGGDDTNLFGGIITSTYVGDTFQPSMIFLKASGIAASPTAIANGKVLGSVIFGGYDGSTWKISNMPSIQVITVGNWTTGETATKMELKNIPSGKTASEKILTLSENGNVNFKYAIKIDDLLAGQSADNGMMRYASNKFQGYENGAWVNFYDTQTLWTAGTGTNSIISINSILPNVALGNYSIAQGEGCLAAENFSNAMGLSVSATSTATHAEGSMTLASGYASHAQNYNTIAHGTCSHAGGYGYDSLYKVIASGISSFNHSTAENGQTSIANGNYSAILGGVNNHTQAEGAIVLGCYGVTASTPYMAYVEKLNIHHTETPLSGDSGDSGTITWDDDYIYIRTNKDGGRWGRIPIEYDF